MDLNLCKKFILKYITLKVVDKFFYYQFLLIAPFLKLYTKYTGASLPKSREHLKKGDFTIWKNKMIKTVNIRI